MSRHTSRNERWTRVNACEYRAAFGAVRYRAGAWEAMVSFERRQAEVNPGLDPVWQQEVLTFGRFKRPRNAMIAAEEKALLLSRKPPGEVRIAFQE